MLRATCASVHATAPSRAWSSRPATPQQPPDQDGQEEPQGERRARGDRGRDHGGCPSSYGLHTRRRYIDPDALRDATRRVVNATLAARHPRVWGEGTTACASDGKHFGAFDQNLMTEWHARYGGRGVIIYWQVERGSVCSHSRLRRCSSSEVAAS